MSNHTSHLRFVNLLIFISLSLGTQANGMDSELSRFNLILSDRNGLQSGVVDFTLTINKFSKEPELEGSVRRHKVWFGDDLYRLDFIEEERQVNPTESLYRKFGYHKGVFRILESIYPDHYVKEFTGYDGLKELPSSVSNFYTDLRLIGVIPLEFGLLKHHKLDELRTFSDNTVDFNKEKSVSHVTVKLKNGVESIFTFDDKFVLPTRVTTITPAAMGGVAQRGAFRTVLESDLEVFVNSKGEKTEFPRSINFSRFEDGELVANESFVVHGATFNEPNDPSIVSWNSLDPPIGASLAKDGSFEPFIQWNGDEFQKLEPGQRLLNDTELKNSVGRTRIRAIAFCLLAGPLVPIFIMGYYKLVRRDIRFQG